MLMEQIMNEMIEDGEAEHQRSIKAYAPDLGDLGDLGATALVIPMAFIFE